MEIQIKILDEDKDIRISKSYKISNNCLYPSNFLETQIDNLKKEVMFSYLFEEEKKSKNSTKLNPNEKI